MARLATAAQELLMTPTGSGQGKVMEFWQNRTVKPSGSPASRVQTQLYDLSNFSEATSRVKMYLHNDYLKLNSYNANMQNFTINELWTQTNWISGHNRPFRIALGIWKNQGGSLLLACEI